MPLEAKSEVVPCYFAIWRQNSPRHYFAAIAKIALTQTLILTLTQILTQAEEKYYFSFRGKIATSLELMLA